MGALQAQRFFFEGVPPRLLGVTALELLAKERELGDAAACLPMPGPDPSDPTVRCRAANNVFLNPNDVVPGGFTALVSVAVLIVVLAGRRVFAELRAATNG